MVVVIIEKNTNIKRLLLFTFASVALVASGFFTNSKTNLFTFTLLMLNCVYGIFFIYQLNDDIDLSINFKFRIRTFFRTNLNKLMALQFFLIIMPLSFYYLNRFELCILSIVALVGGGYCVTFWGKTNHYRLKNNFLLKNLLIGFSWGSLILIGSGSPQSNDVYPLFLIVSLQVFIGSMIRDIPDLDDDSRRGINTFPVLAGLKASFISMHFINAFTVMLVFLCEWSDTVFLIAILTFFWRAINLIALSKSPDNRFWSQTMNLLTCVFIYALTLGLNYANV